MRRLLLAMCCTALLAGCFGKAGPVEEYLRLGQAEGCAGETGAARAKIGVGLRKLRTVDALDRQAVMLAEGRIMSPSQRWYWESPPGRMAEAALAAAMDCSATLSAVWPVRYDSAWAVGLSGSLERFEVLVQEKRFIASVTLQAWDAQDGKPLGAKTFALTEPVPSLDAQGVARAGAVALQRLGQEARQWVEGLAQAAGKGDGK